MKCPSCGKEMELGYIQSRDGVIWTLKKQLLPIFANFGTKNVSLANGACDGNGTVFAHKCSDCKFVLIPYGEEHNKSK